VVLAARGREGLAAAAARLGAEYGPARVHAVAADVGREEDVAALFAEAEGWLAGAGARDGDKNETGVSGLAGVVHAAAVLGPIGPTAAVDPAAWLDAVRVNLFGSYLVAAAAARVWGAVPGTETGARMSAGAGGGGVAGGSVGGAASGSPGAAGGGGSIVLLSGGGATSPFPRYTAYASSKVAVVRLAESLAEELAPLGVRVNALAPGFVATRMHEETLVAGKRAGDDYLRSTREQLAAGGVPPELAGRAAVFLLSDAAAGITGRLVSAPWDRWWEWPARRGQIEESDLFTLRRIVPRDRGADWQ
jgi:NAD(P)-dependent dehydrogenase (short-subunit alcohol dehydrogenase family)